MDDIFDNEPIFDVSPKIEDIFIDDDYLFDESDEQETKDISNNIIIPTLMRYCLKICQNQNLLFRTRAYKKCLPK